MHHNITESQIVDPSTFVSHLSQDELFCPLAGVSCFHLGSFLRCYQESFVICFIPALACTTVAFPPVIIMSL